MIILFAAILLVTVLCLSIYLNWKIHKENKPKQNKEKIFVDNNGNPLFTDYGLFRICWKEMDEWRRRNSTGTFIQQMDREPTEYEIKTGVIETPQMFG
jgi:hypothetical protein